MPTSRNDEAYLKGAGPLWLTCSRCGLVGPKVGQEKGEMPRCEAVTTCIKMEKGESFGGEPWGPSTPSVPKLDKKDIEEIAAAVERYRRAPHPTPVAEQLAEAKAANEEPKAKPAPHTNGVTAPR